MRIALDSQGARRADRALCEPEEKVPFYSSMLEVRRIQVRIIHMHMHMLEIQVARYN
jgi:hypothetical protein